jgi:hypothetical protein
MRPRLLAAGCTLAGTLGLLSLPSAAAHAASRPEPPLSISAKSSYAYGTQVHFTVTLKAKEAGAAVKFYATPAGGKATLVTTAAVNSKGKIYPSYLLRRNTKFTAVFAGDARDAARKVSVSVAAAARVTSSITGFYQTTKISGSTYRLYHANGTLTLHATVAPNSAGQCLEPETQQWDKGVGWDADTKYGCDKLSSKSQDTAPFSLGQAAGDKYRIRARFTHGKNNTAVHSANGGWLYFEVLK